MHANISKIVYHHDYDGSTASFDADLAILILTSEITFTPFIQPACLPSKNSTVIDVRGTVAGYGITENNTLADTLRHVEIPTIDHLTCLYTEPDLASFGSTRFNKFVPNCTFNSIIFIECSALVTAKI